MDEITDMDIDDSVVRPRAPAFLGDVDDENWPEQDYFAGASPSFGNSGNGLPDLSSLYAREERHTVHHEISLRAIQSNVDSHPVATRLVFAVMNGNTRVDSLQEILAEGRGGDPQGCELVAETTDATFASPLTSFSMASFGGPVGATLRFMPSGKTVALVSNKGDGTITLLDPHPDPRLVHGRDGRFASVVPLGGFPAAYTTGMNTVSIASYLSAYYATGSTQCDAHMYVPCAVAAAKDDKGKDEARRETREQSPPSKSLEEMTIDKSCKTAPVGAVVFEPEEVDEGKRKRLQPAPGSPMRIESEESEEKKARAPPIVTTAIPSSKPSPAVAPAPAVVKPKRKSTTTTTAATVGAAPVGAKPKE